MIRRGLSILALAMLLSLTSVALGVARGQVQAAGSIAICRGAVVETLVIDARGEPVTVTHICPDYATMALSVILPVSQSPACHDAPPLRISAVWAGPAHGSMSRLAVPARGPPRRA